jgi:asparagine synthase (glutamine-hydrolysing)
MTDSIAHRGPDGQGQWIEKNVGLGHRRLSILDLTDAAKQPMFSGDNRFVMVYNGEIYNFSQLRDELSLLGHLFTSRGDSEVLLTAFRQWGTNAIPRFNGMFAIAIWDRWEQRLYLARDRYGIKPLYISKQGTNLAFASEQRALITLRDFQKKLDFGGIFEYLSFQNILTNRTMNQDIQLFPPAHFAILDVGAGKTELDFTQYWDFNFQEPETTSSPEEYREELDRLLVQAVNSQLISDVEIGSYLSGGMDSGSITAIASRSIPNLKTFTCGFDLASASGIELEFDERNTATALSNFFKTVHFEVLLNSTHMENSLNKIAWHLEEPRVGQSYPNYYAAKLASEHVKVVLSGAGGDELFGGYPWRYSGNRNFANFNEYSNQYFNYWQRLLTDDEMKSLTFPIRRHIKDLNAREIFRDLLAPSKYEPRTKNDFINASLRFEAKTFLHGLLIVEDKLSMAHGLETRLPFLDNALVDYAMQCPIELKIDPPKIFSQFEREFAVKNTKNHIETYGDGKKILRDVMAHYLPKDSLNRKKQGFSGPDASWFKGESLEYVRKTLSEVNSPIFDYLDYATTQTLLNQHLSGQQNRRLLVWSLLNLNQLFASY